LPVETSHESIKKKVGIGISQDLHLGSSLNNFRHYKREPSAEWIFLKNQGVVVVKNSSNV